MIEIELSYMNTNHPDFIGFDRYSNNKYYDMQWKDSSEPLPKFQEGQYMYYYMCACPYNIVYIISHM